MLTRKEALGLAAVLLFMVLPALIVAALILKGG